MTPNAVAAVRPLSPAEFAADRMVHIAGVAAAAIGAGAILIGAGIAGGAPRIVAATLYAIALVALFGFSAAYNVGVDYRHRELVRRFDHASIFVLIAGTYTPFTVLGLTGAWSIAMTATVWVIAAIGVGLKLLAPQRRYEGLSVALYVVFGWIGLVAIVPLVEHLPSTILILLGLGGLIYSIGVIFHVSGALRFQAAIWHVFTLVAAAFHYAAVGRLVFGP